MSFKSFLGQTSDSTSTNLSQAYQEQVLQESINKIISNNIRPKATTLQVYRKDSIELFMASTGRRKTIGRHYDPYIKILLI